MFKVMGVIFVTLATLHLSGSYAAMQAPPQPLNTAYFLALSDIHFDPFTHCPKIKPCPLIVKLQRAPANQWAALLAQYDIQAPRYRLNSNYSLLTSALTASKRVALAKQAKFVLVLGDFLGHKYRHYYRIYSGDKTATGYISFVRKTLSFLTGEFARAFPAIDVYSVVGNNDSYQGDYVIRPEGEFFKDAAFFWSSLIKTPANRLAMRAQFRKAGYYSLSIPSDANLRLIVLNSTFFSYKAKGKDIDKFANEQLNWLHAQLKLAKEKNQTVFIAMHIPISIDIFTSAQFKLFTLFEFWKKNYRQRFRNDMQQFAPHIAGVFTGHLHSDWLHVLTFPQAEKVTWTGIPSISPIFGNQPAFKIYTYSLKPLQLQNNTTYYYRLNTNRTWEP